MSDESRRDAAKDQDQMKDQEGFHEDPRGKQEVAEQQPETQPGESDPGTRPDAGEDEGRGETGRDEAGEATGNPPNAG